MAVALTHLSNLQLAKGDLPTAEKTARRSLEIAQNALTANHPNLAYLLTALGLVLTRRGQPAAGEKYLREALEIRNRVMNNNFWRVAETEGALGECLTAQGKFADAETFLRTSFEHLKLSQGREHSRSALAKRRIEELYKAWNKPVKLE